MDMNEFLKQLFGEGAQLVDPRQAAQSQYRDMKGLFQPSWRDVIQKQRATSMFLELGQEIGRHVSTCTDPECPFGHGRVSFCNLDFFLASVKFHCDRYADVDPEANDLFMLWVSRDRTSLQNDPRYIAFRCNFDKQMLLAAVLKETLQDAFQNASLKVE